MNDEEVQRAEDHYAAFISDTPAADALYDELTDFGTLPVISTDLARLLCPVYRCPSAGALRDTRPSMAHAWKYSQGRLEREIARRGGREILRFMAGGWAAGKTTALRSLSTADLAWDGTLGDPEWAGRMMDLALVHGWEVQVAYVYRPMDLAIQGALNRGLEEGRMVPLRELPRSHAAAQRSVVRLHSRWAGEGVTFRLFYNGGTRTRPEDVLELSISDIAEGGGLCLSENDLQFYECYACDHLEQARNAGSHPAYLLDAAGA